jgi:hypothetical protein
MQALHLAYAGRRPGTCMMVERPHVSIMGVGYVPALSNSMFPFRIVQLLGFLLPTEVFVVGITSMDRSQNFLHLQFDS